MQVTRKTATAALIGALMVASVQKAGAVSRSGLDIIHSFSGGAADGASSSAALMQAADGNFYGTTFAGGSFNSGVVFNLTASGSTSVLHAFTGGADGASPFAAVIQASDGKLYGTTYRGGAFGAGTIFSLNPNGTGFTTLYSFAGGAGSGANPRAALIQAADGSFYGTTELGGSAGRGTLFQMVGGVVTLLYTFTGGFDGAYPYAPLTLASDGNFYGTTYGGDFSTFGRVFRMSPGGGVTVVHTFTSGADGANPVAPVVQGSDGNFYGTTFFGGTSNAGTAFRMASSGVVTVLHSFTGGTDGANPGGGLLQWTDGDFYGTTRVGAAGYGTIFRVSAAGAFALVHGFTGGGDGAVPGAAVIQARNGRLYGTAAFGGSAGLGVAFRLPTISPFDFDGDGKSDVAVFRPSNGNWYIRNSLTGINQGLLWGGQGDVPVAGDYDGDGLTDMAVFRPSNGTWYVRTPTGAMVASVWGGVGDVPTQGDYDGDGRTDIAVFRPSNGIWYVRNSNTGVDEGLLWGGNGDVAVPGDYDGDGRTDIAVFRPSNGTWYVRLAATGAMVASVWGGVGDIPVPGDYDADGRTDIAVFRASSGIWYIRNSNTGLDEGLLWGGPGDVPTPADFDADGKTDMAVFRPSNGTWYIRSSINGQLSTVIWGGGGDIPIMKRP